MAIYPGAVVKLIPRHNRPLNATQLILHTAVSGAVSLYGYFSNPNTDVASHFYVREDGTVEQYVDTRFQAPANRNANASAISVETWDGGNPNATPWNARQIATLLRLAIWCRTVHGIPLRPCTSPTAPGVGFHSMWGAPSAWTPAAGKTCPGPARIPQVAGLIAAASRTLLTNSDPEDDVLKDQTVTNPISGQPESLDVTIAYMEQRIVNSLKAQLPSLVAQAVLDAPITSAVDGKTVAPLKQFLAWIDRATNVLANRKES